MNKSVPDFAPPSYDGAMAQPQQAHQPSSQDRLNMLREMSARYELAGGAIAKLRKLESYDVVVIADDSSSMRNAAHEANPNQPFQNVPTRWDELRERVVQIMDLACCLDQDGIDIYFLNRPPVFNINDASRARALFAEPPSGYTPLTACYKRVLQDKLGQGNEGNKVMIVVATDGEPNMRDHSGTWRKDIGGFEALLKHRAGYSPRRCPTTIMACTDSDHEVGWLNRLDDSVQCLDVVDDFRAERQEILQVQGPSFPFTLGDYVVKTLVGPLDSLYDDLDEKKLSRKQMAAYLGVSEDQVPKEHKNKDGSCSIS